MTVRTPSAPCYRRTGCAARPRLAGSWAGCWHTRKPSYTHAQLQSALAGEGDGDSKAAEGAVLDRVTLYRLIDRLTQVGLLLCRVDVNRARRYQAMPSSVHAIAHFECHSCHRDSPLDGPFNANVPDLERAAQTALEALKALGYRDMTMDFAVRGVCVDRATGSSSTPTPASTAR